MAGPPGQRAGTRAASWFGQQRSQVLAKPGERVRIVGPVVGTDRSPAIDEDEARAVHDQPARAVRGKGRVRAEQPGSRTGPRGRNRFRHAQLEAVPGEGDDGRLRSRQEQPAVGIRSIALGIAAEHLGGVVARVHRDGNEAEIPRPREVLLKPLHLGALERARLRARRIDEVGQPHLAAEIGKGQGRAAALGQPEVRDRPVVREALHRALRRQRLGLPPERRQGSADECETQRDRTEREQSPRAHPAILTRAIMPPSMCMGLWQWKNQSPGLWAVNSMSTAPMWASTSTLSLMRGRASRWPLMARTAKDCPWRCMGCASMLMLPSLTRTRSPRFTAIGSVDGYCLPLIVHSSEPIIPPLSVWLKLRRDPEGAGS